MKKTKKSKKPFVPDYPGKDIDDLAASVGVVDYDNDPIRESKPDPVYMDTRPKFVEDLDDYSTMPNFNLNRKTDFEVKKGGSVKIPKSKISTGQSKNKKHTNW